MLMQMSFCSPFRSDFKGMAEQILLFEIVDIKSNFLIETLKFLQDHMHVSLVLRP